MYGRLMTYDIWEIYGHISCVWLVVTGTWLDYFPYMVKVMIPIDFHIFQRGWNHQPVCFLQQKKLWCSPLSNTDYRMELSTGTKPPGEAALKEIETIARRWNSEGRFISSYPGTMAKSWPKNMLFLDHYPDANDHYPLLWQPPKNSMVAEFFHVLWFHGCRVQSWQDPEPGLYMSQPQRSTTRRSIHRMATMLTPTNVKSFGAPEDSFD